MMRGFFVAMVLIALAYVLGFVAFISLLPKTPADLKGADGIVVLTGGETRLDRAVSLFESGVGKRLLISGVDETFAQRIHARHVYSADQILWDCASLRKMYVPQQSRVTSSRQRVIAMSRQRL